MVCPTVSEPQPCSAHEQQVWGQQISQSSRPTATTLLLWEIPLLFMETKRPADTAKSVHAATRKTLLKVKGFSEVKVEKIKEAISKLQVFRHASSPYLLWLHRSVVARIQSADDASHTSPLHLASSQQSSSVTTGREYVRSQLVASSWTLFLEGEPVRANCRAPSG